MKNRRKILHMILSTAMLFAMSAQTASVVLAEESAEYVTASPTSSNVFVNDKMVQFDAYNINDNNYFKLRDLASALNGTEKNFEVSWDDTAQTIVLTSGQAYTFAGGEIEDTQGTAKTAEPASAKVVLDGEGLSLTAYNIDGYNYFMLRDIGEAMDFAVNWVEEENAVLIETSKGHSEETAGDDASMPAVKTMTRTSDLFTMAYQEYGDSKNPALVLIHGATDSHISWSQVAAVLADEYYVVLPELRGHGGTSKPKAGVNGYTITDYAQDVLWLLQELKIEKAFVGGHSLGSFVAQEITLAKPELVSSLILAGSGAKATGNPTLEWLLNGDEEFPGLRGFEEFNMVPEEFTAEWTITDNRDPEFAKATYEHALTLPYSVWIAIFEGLQGVDNTERLDEISVPTLIIWGDEDTFFVEADQAALVKALSNTEAKFETIPGASHNIHWDKDNAAVVAKMIRDFIAADTE